MPKFLPNRQAMITKTGVEKGEPWVVHLGSPSVPASGAVARANAGSVIVILDGPIERSGYTWWKCRAGGQNGWIAEPGLVPLLLANETVYVDYESEGYTLRAQPDKGSAAVAGLPAGTPLRAFAMNEPAFSHDFAFWRVITVNNLQGWVATESLRFGFAPNSTAAVPSERDSAALLRAQPDLQAAVIRALAAGETLLITGGPAVNDHKGWWKVRARDKVEGWVTEGDLKSLPAQG